MHRANCVRWILLQTSSIMRLRGYSSEYMRACCIRAAPSWQTLVAGIQGQRSCVRAVLVAMSLHRHRRTQESERKRLGLQDGHVYVPTIARSVLELHRITLLCRVNSACQHDLRPSKCFMHMTKISEMMRDIDDYTSFRRIIEREFFSHARCTCTSIV